MNDWRKARKRPVVIDVRGPIEAEETIATREGTLVAAPGDLIIRGVKGEVYPIAPDIFTETYELVE